MRTAVLAEDGHTYERQAIEAWIKTCKVQRQAPRSPLSGALLGGGRLQLFPNHSLRKIISDFLDAHPAIRRSAEAEAADAAADLLPERLKKVVLAGNVARTDPGPPPSDSTDERRPEHASAVSGGWIGEDGAGVGVGVVVPESLLTAASDGSVSAAALLPHRPLIFSTSSRRARLAASARRSRVSSCVVAGGRREGRREGGMQGRRAAGGSVLARTHAPGPVILSPQPPSAKSITAVTFSTIPTRRAAHTRPRPSLTLRSCWPCP